NSSIEMCSTEQCTATGTNTHDTTQELTSRVTWTSANTVCAASDSAGLATSVAAGMTTITATLGGVSGSTTLTVTAATLSTIDVTPTDPSIANGTTRQFTATGTYSDCTTQDLTTQMAWIQSRTDVVTNNNAGRPQVLST